MISVLDTSDYSILWTVPNNPYDVMGAWVPIHYPPSLTAHQWLSGIQHRSIDVNLLLQHSLDELLL